MSYVKHPGLPRLWRDVHRDARHGLRTLLKSPGFALVTIAALAVGIGANLTIFGFVNALLLRPLTATDSHRLVRADRGGPNAVENTVVYDDYVAYRDRNQTLSQLALRLGHSGCSISRQSQCYAGAHASDASRSGG